MKKLETWKRVVKKNEKGTIEDAVRDALGNGKGQAIGVAKWQRPRGVPCTHGTAKTSGGKKDS